MGDGPGCGVWVVDFRLSVYLLRILYELNKSAMRAGLRIFFTDKHVNVSRFLCFFSHVMDLRAVMCFYHL